VAHDQAAALSDPALARFSSVSSATRRTAFVEGYSLHADREIDVDDRDALERLRRYGARSPIANSRLSLDGRGRVFIALRDGRRELVFAPSEFIRRLGVLVPPPKRHLTRYHGVLAPHHRWRSAVVPSPAAGACEGDAARPIRRRLDWAALMKRVFAIDVFVCDACGGAMRILAVQPDGDGCHAILDHLGYVPAPPTPCALAPPDDPFESHVPFD
jgi:hypothetical protein